MVYTLNVTAAHPSNRGYLTSEMPNNHPEGVNASIDALAVSADEESNLSIHRGRACTASTFSALPVINEPIPAMSDEFWVCPDCGQMNNPVLAPERCSICGYSR